jgi:hypothetical protein
MMELRITWQRLVDDQGQTCDRCSATGNAVRRGVEMLHEALAPLGIAVIAEERMLGRAEFMRAPLESNRIRIGGRMLEEWLGADTGQSRCCGPCGEEECRSVSFREQYYEAIPTELVLKAGLMAAAHLLPLPPGKAVLDDPH